MLLEFRYSNLICASIIVIKVNISFYLAQNVCVCVCERFIVSDYFNFVDLFLYLLAY